MCIAMPYKVRCFMACRDKRILHSDHHKIKKRQTYQFSQTGPARMCSFNPNKAKIVWNFCTCEAQRPTESTITLLSFNLDAHSINATAEFQVTPGMCQLQHMDLSRNRNPGCSLAPQHPIGWNKFVPRKGFLHKDSTTASRVTCAPACLRVDALQDAFRIYAASCKNSLPKPKTITCFWKQHVAASLMHSEPCQTSMVYISCYSSYQGAPFFQAFQITRTSFLLAQSSTTLYSPCTLTLQRKSTSSRGLLGVPNFGTHPIYICLYHICIIISICIM